MKKILLTLTASLVSIVLMQSCHNNNPNSTGVNTGADSTKDSSTAIGSDKGADTATMQSANTNNGGVAKSDNEFVTKASGGGMMEVELGKIAQANASSAAIKEYGKMLETDHSKANAELASIAAAENINVPTAMPQEHVAHIDGLKARMGKDFDKAYIDMMVEDHVKDIAEFKKAAKENSDEKVKAFAAKTLPTLENHLAKAKAIQSSLK